MPVNEPTDLSFVLPAGDSALIKLIITDADDVPLNISGMVLGFSAEKVDDPATRVDLAVGTGITIIDAVVGSIEILIPKATVLIPGKWRDEVEVIDGVDSQTVAEGIIKVTRTLNPST